MNNQVILFAKQELKKYLVILGVTADVAILREESIRFAFENEDFLQPVFDCQMYKGVVNGRIRVANPEIGASELIGNAEVVLYYE